MDGGILRGVRVLEWTVVWAGPQVANFLADMGAEVIHVDHPKYYGVMGQYSPGSTALFAKELGMGGNVEPEVPGYKQDAPWLGVYDMESAAPRTNRKFLALDTTVPEGRDLLHKLIKVSDVVLENLTPSVVAKLGIAYDQIKDVNPRIIKCTMSAYGQGPWSDYVAYGSTLEAATGMSSLTGYGGDDGDRPMQSTGGGFVVDPVAGMQAVGAIMCALIQRNRTGAGMEIEVSQYEAGTHLTNAVILDYVMNKRIRVPIGNRDKNFPWQGCYPAKGVDQWVVISIRNQKEWENLCCTIGKKEWLNDEGLSQVSRLGAYQDAVEAGISAWTKLYSKEESSQRLQNISIAAAPANTIEEGLFDAQVMHRGAYKWVDYPYGPSAPTVVMPVRFSKTPFPEVYRAAQGVGADNNYIYSQLLGLSASEIKALESKKIIAR